MAKLTQYEREQMQAIEKWKREEPGVLTRAFGVIVEPAAWLVRKVVPEAAVRGTLDCANATAKWLTDEADILRDGRVGKVEDLRKKDLHLSDDLADEVHNWAIGLGVAEGGMTGAFGILGARVDIPAIITLALRTVHKIGVCYGFRSQTELGRQFVLGVMAASGANSMEEKTAALATLTAVRQLLLKVTWKKMAQKAAENQLGKEAGVIALRNLAKQIGINITKRRALAAIPVIGAAIGGSVNGWYLKEVGWAARRSYQDRWLSENGKVVPVT